MTEGLVIDTSVFIAAARPKESGHLSARRLMDECIDKGIPLAEPTILLPELLGALARTGSSSGVVRRIVGNYREQARLNWEPVDLGLAQAAGDIATAHKIKGADAVYVALASELGVPLVTLDREQRDRAPADIEVLTPEQALARG